MFKSIEFLLTILACALTSAWADVFRLGRCPQVKLQRDFKSSLFAGEWFEISRNPILLLSNTKCNKLSLTYHDKMYDMRVSSVLKSFDNKQVSLDAHAFSTNPAEPAQLVIKYPLNIFRTNLTFQYWVMHTDYDQSALIWSCIEYLKLFHLEYFWILSRKPYLNDDKLMDISDMLDFNGISSAYAVKTEQTGCI